MFSVAPQTITSFLRGDVFAANQDEVRKQNRLALRYFAAAGIPVSIANLLSQSFVVDMSLASLKSLWLPFYYLLLFLLDRVVIPMNYKHATRLAYVCEVPVLLLSILLGTIWDPNHQAITFLMIMITAPVFILDRPVRIAFVMLCWNVAFIAMCVIFKDPSLIKNDLLHALEFYLMSMGATYVVLMVRLDALNSLERTRYHLEHDVATDAQNKRSLAVNARHYANKPLFVAVGDIDHFRLLNDFYGQEAGDGLLLSFANILKNTYGPEYVYRYGGDTMLALLEDDNTDEGLRRIQTCQQQFATLHDAIVHSQLTSSFGYTWGTPKSESELRDMIQLAVINVNRAKRQGEGKTIGTVYDDDALRKGIIESNVATHARAYEINQLTGLPSVAYFITRTTELLKHAVDMDRVPVIGFLNLVRFKDYNNSFGYAQGDELIKTTADLLRKYLPRRHVAYISGGQFAVMCYRDEVDPLMRHMTRDLIEFKPNRSIAIKAGFAEYTTDHTVISLLDSAKLAHESIAEQRAVTFRMYDPELDEEVRLRQHLISHLDEAIANDWIKVYYQPIVHASSGEICNMEALARWDDPTYGFLSPASFIGVLERERIIYKLTLHIARQIMRDLKRLERHGVPLVPVSINLSRNDFFECDLAEEIRTIVDESGYSRRMLNLEITESAFAEDQGLLKNEVDRLRSMGFAVWMDDFGSEYSTLNLLENLNFDLIKVDMQFMRNFDGTGKNAIILADIIGMCRRLGITTLVEGVETKEQYQILQSLGTDKLQGYLFSKPCSLDDLFGKL